MTDFKQLKVWQQGKEIAIQVYRLSTLLEQQAAFTFSAQITRVALSIPSNIAEGSSRRTETDYLRFLELAQGSAFELETQLEIINGLGLIESSKAVEIIALLNEEQEMIYELMGQLKNPESS